MDQLAKDRQRFLLSELGSIREYFDTDSIPKPAEVKAAERTIEQWQKQRDAKRDKFRKDLLKKKNRIRHEIYFGSQEKAAKMVQALQEEYPAN